MAILFTFFCYAVWSLATLICQSFKKKIVMMAMAVVMDMGEDGNGGDGNEGTGQDDAQPSNSTAEPASGNVGEIISPTLLQNYSLFELLHRQLMCSY
jgi:hypothetical protein